MPLTFSHPAIVLPLSYLPKRWVSLTGLVAGRVAPDFEYFFRMKVYSIYSHTWLGLLWFDVPVAMMLAFVYHNTVKAAFIANLPRELYHRFAGYAAFNWSRYAKQNLPVVVLSILIGGTSHLLWDSFTHVTGYFVEYFNMASPVKILFFQIPLYKAVQHLSTLVGGAIIIAAICKLPLQASTKQHPQNCHYWPIVGISIFIILSLRVVLGLPVHKYWNILVTAISGALLGIVLASATTGLKTAAAAGNPPSGVL
ncbi:DUF4184 family protein [Mucilaginibacter paludis]|uniref:DUF4184 family protein n=1 Tax=Mucilaginibacter paludis DSM 18603 TaxID=714943 RepID=H1YCR9_9SPHI|nr:DUF4184 family protein [Mucilaginibacter paludis]EHQ24256.1 hypothetical protein Mucpa_0052 [Mucilaginibacter paludis DSM 18603]